MKNFKSYKLTDGITFYITLKDWGCKFGYSYEEIEEYENLIYLQILCFSLEFSFTLRSKKKSYVCTNCKSKNTLYDSGIMIVGYCKKCGHPIWN